MSEKINSLKFPSGRTLRDCRKDAKRLSRLENIPLHVALDRVALNNGRLPWDEAVHVLSLPVVKPDSVMNQALMSRKDIEAIMASHPYLTHYGIGISLHPVRKRSEYESEFNAARESLLSAIDECNRACLFLKHVERRKTINKGSSSYGLKHDAEFYCSALGIHDQPYIANGSFICAAYYLGFQVATVDQYPNAFINYSQRSPVLEWRRLKNLSLFDVRDFAKLKELEKLLGLPESKF